MGSRTWRQKRRRDHPLQSPVWAKANGWKGYLLALMRSRASRLGEGCSMATTPQVGPSPFALKYARFTRPAWMILGKPTFLIQDYYPNSHPIFGLRGSARRRWLWLLWIVISSGGNRKFVWMSDHVFKEIGKRVPWIIGNYFLSLGHSLLKIVSKQVSSGLNSEGSRHLVSGRYWRLIIAGVRGGFFGFIHAPLTPFKRTTGQNSKIPATASKSRTRDTLALSSAPGRRGRMNLRKSQVTSGAHL
jgi:hypothetical protein